MPRQPAARFGQPLSFREIQVLRHVANGDTVATAAKKLGIAYGTARTCMYRAQAKLGAYSASNAIAIALAAKIIRPVTIRIPEGITR